MAPLNIDEFIGTECELDYHELADYETDTPRWCKGCGDHGVLLAVQQLLQEEQTDPETVVAVSGIGCSSRFPHYLKTYGFHGIHGRALPLSLGVSLARPDLRVLTIMGDGDCFSIGAGHWLHTIRYNPDIMVLVLDNEVYALTKNQVSPTSALGTVTNTTPRGAYLKNMNPLSVILAVKNVSFLAQSATLNPPHMEATLRKAWAHRGLSFVRILQRCPVYMPDLFSGMDSFTPVYLENEDGIPLDKSMLRKANVMAHDHRDINAAQRLVQQEDAAPMGLIYSDPDVPTYGDIRHGQAHQLAPVELIAKLNLLLNKYSVTAHE